MISPSAMSDSASSTNFTWIDYLVFIAMLLVSSGIGVYFAYKVRATLSLYCRLIELNNFDELLHQKS